MKKTFLKLIVGTALTLLVVVGGGQITALGQDDEELDQIEESEARNYKRSIVGVWLTQVTRRNCDTGDPIGATSQIQLTFAKGDTLLETIGPSVLRTQGNGVWKRGRPNKYYYALRFMRYDAAGAFVGSGIVRAALTLDATGDHYTATATNDILDVNGNVTGSGCATSVSTRFSMD